MSNHTFSELVGKKLRIDVAEPWDFFSAAGQNVLEGTVTGTSSLSTMKPWLLCSLSEFAHEGARIVEAVLVSRHREKEPVWDLLNGSRVGVNIVFDAGGGLSSGEEIEALLKRRVPFLAGSARLV